MHPDVLEGLTVPNRDAEHLAQTPCSADRAFDAAESFVQTNCNSGRLDDKRSQKHVGAISLSPGDPAGIL